jgi:hypothetical protein
MIGIVDRLLGRTPHRRQLEAEMDEAVAAVQSLRQRLRGESIADQADAAKTEALSALRGLRTELSSQPDH